MPQRAAAQERIGRYEVLRRIATGGMAELFLAKHVGMEGFEKVVAIKRILAHLAHDEEFVNMFRDEARLVAKLSHPNIVQIYDLGKSADSYFIAMEYIPGRNLASIAKKARAKGEAFPPVFIARAIGQACEALHYAHTRTDADGRSMGIVHRDVSPQNIILAFSGAVKLVDFGIAKAATKIAHTRAGVLKGKYAYMSPEQIKGEEIDARSDVFSAGIVLFELLCGKRPFEKDNSIQTLKSIVQEPHVDPRKINPDVPEGLAEIIHKALTKDRRERYQSAQELQIALEDYVSSSGERANTVVVGEWVSKLFEDELDRGKGGIVQLKGGGEVILPASEKIERSSPDMDVAIDEASSDLPDPPATPPPSPPPAAVRGGGSVMGREGSPPGRRGLLEEGVIGGGKRPPAGRGGDEEATAIATGESEPDLAEAYAEVGPVAQSIDDSDQRPLYEEGARPASDAPPGGSYDDSHTEHAVNRGLRAPSAGSPTIDLLPPRAVTPDFGGGPSILAPARTLASSAALRGVVHSSAPPVAPSRTPAGGQGPANPPPPSRSANNVPALQQAPAARRAPSPAPQAPPALDSPLPVTAAVEAPLDLGLASDDLEVRALDEDATMSRIPTPSAADDPWGDKTVASDGDLDEQERPSGLSSPDEIPSWNEDQTTTGPPAFGALNKGSPRELPTRSQVDADMWDEKTTGAPDDPAELLFEGAPQQVAVVDPEDEAWSEKTIGMPSEEASMLGELGMDATSGMSVEEIAAKVSDGRERSSALPGAGRGGLGYAVEDHTWGDQVPDEPAATGAWNVPSIAELDDGDVLPASVDRDRNVDADSRTVAASASDYSGEGIELSGSEGSFAYDEPTRDTGENAVSTSTKPKSALGAIKLAKVAAAPPGGVNEIGLVDEHTSELGTEQLSAKALQMAAKLKPAPAPVPAPSRSAALPGSGGSSRATSRAEPPVRAQAIDPNAALEEGTYNEPNLPPGGGVLGDFDLEGLFAPAAPSPMMPSDPLASIGSTRVPPANVSLSSMLLERSDISTRPQPRGASQAPTAPAPLKSASSIRGGSVAGSAPASRPVTQIRAIKESRRPGGMQGAPTGTGLQGIGTPVGAAETLPMMPPSPQVPNPMYPQYPQSAFPQGMAPPGNFPGGYPQSMTPGMAPPRPRARMSTAQLVTIVVSCVVIAMVLAAIGYVKLKAPSLEIRTTPVGARVFLDGMLLEGQTPLSVPIEPDRDYTIRIVREGFEDHQGTVRIPRDKKAWMASFTLKQSGGVSVPIPAPPAPSP